MKKVKNQKGFTLAELLIVVAIIGVLVAVAIPTFSNQLEKAREATDIANARDVYAEISVALVSGVLDENNTSMTVLGDKTASYTHGDDESTVEISGFPVKQTISDWEGGHTPDIAGVTVSGTPIYSASGGTLKFTFTTTKVDGNKTSYTYLSAVEFS